MATEQDRKEAARATLRKAFEAAPDAPQDMYDLLSIIGGPKITVQKSGENGDVELNRKSSRR